MLRRNSIVFHLMGRNRLFNKAKEKVMDGKGFKVIGTIMVVIGVASLGLLGLVFWAVVKIINHFF